MPDILGYSHSLFLFKLIKTVLKLFQYFTAVLPVISLSNMFFSIDSFVSNKNFSLISLVFANSTFLFCEKIKL